MILIADSGSSKTDWKLLSKNESNQFKTIGLNPLNNASESFQKECNSFLSTEKRKLVSMLYFFGAGCSHQDIVNKVTKELTLSFPNAKIFVDSDLLGACLSTCGNEKGLVAILGTGSNFCYFDGEKIAQKTNALGFAIGDEASGADFGKALLKAYFYRELPEDLEQQFEAQFELKKSTVLERVYRKPLPNKYLASFFPFILKNKDHPFIQALIALRFDEFFKRHVYKYQEALSLPLHFVGSVGFLLKEELESYLKNHNMKVGNFVRSPIDGIVENLHSLTYFGNKPS